ncbi:filamentous hemagglutinin N-terminal domain-containing protein, partial [Salmonella enterica subsp. enterica]|nr:filamentous hemagglutinin N-terminal domain-containing protein [Salmonella enterica subsp. enterica]EDV9391408.1 filamentous hemagglutinin N-terminal domain-containing protein [Salmonella enterica subsp. enterica]
MNKIYKLIFDKRRGELVVVSEITAGLGKSGTTGQVVAPSSGSVRLGKLRPVTILIGSLLGMLPAHHVLARAATLLPTGGQIVVGQGNISSSGSTMTITQGSQKLGTNWNTFDIGQGNSVVFVQPGSSAVALNRVTGGGGASQIMGTLTANGQVFLLNPNGVLVGKTGQVNTAGFVASTQSISDSDFAGGNITLRSVGNGSIINQGNLTSTAGGYVVLSGGQVTNQGTITTPGGRTVMASADQVTLSLDGAGLTGVSVNGAVVNALVKNQGLIVADNGQVQLTARGQDMLLSEAVNNSGIIRAQGLSQQGGSIVLDGGNSGVVTQAGTLDVSSATVRGGKVVLEGQNIHLTGGSLINATGQTGGGQVYTGGGWQGKDGSITNADAVVMDSGAVIDVSATGSGNGGTAVLWSDKYTNFRGDILARGGISGGHGGQVETSSHNNLQAFGRVDAGAAKGSAGNWLLDPADVTIVNSAVDVNVTNATSGDAGIFSPTATVAQIGNQSINNQLNNGTSVTIQTSGASVSGQLGNITLSAAITKTSGGDANLSLIADNNITSTLSNVGAIQSWSGALNLNLLAGNTTNGATVNLGAQALVDLNGGNYYVGSANASNRVNVTSAELQIRRAGNVTFDQIGSFDIGHTNYVNAAGNFILNATGSVNFGSVNLNMPGRYNIGGNFTVNSSSSVVLNGTVVSATGANSAVSIMANRAGANAVTLNNSSVLTSGAGATVSVSGSSDHWVGVTIANTTINGTSAGAVLVNGTSSSANGTILNNATLTNATIRGTQLAGNSATTGLYVTGGSTLISNSSLSGGSVAGWGANITSGTVISNSKLALQTTNYGIAILNGTITNSEVNATSLNVSCGAYVSLAMDGGGVNISNTTINVNAAGAAGGITKLGTGNYNDVTVNSKSTGGTGAIQLCGTIRGTGNLTLNGNDSAGGTGVLSLANTLVNVAGSLSITGCSSAGTGVSFGNGTITVDGSLNITNANAPVLLTNENITTGGAVNVDAAGRIEVTSTRINASGINLISNSSVGNGISILSSNLTVANGLNFTASNSAISINNSNINSSGESVLFGRAVTNSDWGGVTFRKTNVIVNSGNFTVSGILSCSTSYAGVYLASANLIVNNGAKVVLNGTQSVAGLGDSAGVKIGNPVYESGDNSISGCGSVNIYGVSSENYGINVDNSYSFRISGGVNVSFYGASVSGTGFSQGSGSYQGFTYITDGSSVNISGTSRSGSGVVYGASVGLDASDDSSLVVSGTSTSGTGVALGAVNINNANISGISSSGVGVVISGRVGAGGSTSLTGSSAGSDGVSITGNVVGGAVSGSSGNGSGVTV